MTAVPCPSIRVLVVDDSPLVREGIRAVLESYGREAGLTVVGEAASVAEAITRTAKDKPDLVLMDIRLPDGSGLEACRSLLLSQPNLRILILTSFADDDFVYDAVSLGVSGYVMKDIDPHGLIAAIRDVMAGRSVLAPNVSDRIVHLVRSGKRLPDAEARLAALSPQERRVVTLLADGLTNKEIARQLGLSDNTVKNYLVGVYGKLGVKRRSEAAVCFYKGARTPNRPG
jgi:DNA-binding NarL/FixJ family response regulator